MKMIKPSYQIMTPINGEEILKSIELAARTCYKSEAKIGSLIKCSGCIFPMDCKKGIMKFCNFKRSEKQTIVLGVPSEKELIYNKLMRLGHDAMIEFGGMITVKFICDRGVSHELVRHRLCSFAQESTRYCNYGKQEHVQFIIPNWLDIKEGIIDGNGQFDSPTRQYISVLANAEFNYNLLIKEWNWTPQQARSVLPNSLKTEINLSANTGEWRHIFKQRTSKAAHPQMRELMIPLLEEFKKRIPLLYDDILY